MRLVLLRIHKCIRSRAFRVKGPLDPRRPPVARVGNRPPEFYSALVSPPGSATAKQTVRLMMPGVRWTPAGLGTEIRLRSVDRHVRLDGVYARRSVGRRGYNKHWQCVLRPCVHESFSVSQRSRAWGALPEAPAAKLSWGETRFVAAHAAEEWEPGVPRWTEVRPPDAVRLRRTIPADRRCLATSGGP